MEFLFLFFAVLCGFVSGLYVQDNDALWVGILMLVLSLLATFLVTFHMLGVSL